MQAESIFTKSVEIIEKKSKFYGFLIENADEGKIKEGLSFLKKEYKKATHICWACSIENPFCERAVDDGEPSGTAGRPILSVIQKRGAKNVCIFIVRYFGGIKLGAGGLVRIYTKVAGELLKMVENGNNWDKKNWQR